MQNEVTEVISLGKNEEGRIELEVNMKSTARGSSKRDITVPMSPERQGLGRMLNSTRFSQTNSSL